VAALLLLAGQLTSPTSATADASSGAVGAATCGPGSSPENGVQGEVPLVDRHSGRNTQGYTGIRVFDISHPTAVREIAYFNPPAQAGKRALLLNSDHANGIAASLAPVLSDLSNLDLGYPPLEVGPANLSADYCSSPPSFVGDELWVTCQDNGFLALQFTNGSYRPVT
jgi:hypothetical protein